jgi:hypothetical protein
MNAFFGKAVSAVLVSATFMVFACSDGGGGLADSRRAVDTGAGDAPADVAPLDHGLPDQPAGDLSIEDQARDSTASSLGSIKITVTAGAGITCGSTQSDDCQGALLIAVTENHPGLVQEHIQYLAGDLAGGKQETHTFTGLPADMAFIASGVLFEGGQPSTDHKPFAGDLIPSSYPPATVVGGQVVSVDLVLDTRYQP